MFVNAGKSAGGFGRHSTYRGLYKTRVSTGLGELLDDIKAWTETTVSVVPGASGPVAVYEWQEGRKVAALLTLLFSGPVASIVGKKLGGLALKTFDEINEVLPKRALEQLAAHPKEREALVKILNKTSGGLDEQLEVVRKFIAENQDTIGRVGNIEKRAGTETMWRTILTANPGIQRKADYQVHHLITLAEAQESKALNAAANVGYDINNAKNLLPLPDNRQSALDDLLPLHRGPHPTEGEASEYIRFLNVELDKLDRAWRGGKGFMTYKQLFDRIDQLSDRLREGLGNLEWKLSRNDPH